MSKFSNTLGGDRRGVSTVLGFVLIFGILVVSFSVYQAEVVPEQNEEVEFEHYQEVREQMTELRSNLVLISESTSTRAVSVDLAARYPSRAIFVNPPPATGELRTVGTDDTEVSVTIENATAVDGETADFWDGDNVTYDTGTIEYDPDYNRQRGTPPLVYEQTLLHNNVEDGGQSVPLTGQSLVNDNRIKLITLDGSLRETSVGTESVDLEPVSTRSRVVGVENRGGPITIEFASRMGVSAWEETLANEMSAGHVEHIRSIGGGPDGFSILELVLEPGQRYQLELAKVGVGTGVTDTNESYITTVEEADASMPTNTTQQITVEVRDKFNNPQSNIDVTASASVGELRPSGEAGSSAGTVTASSRSDGRVTFLYQAAQNGSHQVNLTFSNTSGNVAGLSNETYVKQNITVGSGSDNNDTDEGDDDDSSGDIVIDGSSDDIESPGNGNGNGNVQQDFSFEINASLSEGDKVALNLSALDNIDYPDEKPGQGNSWKARPDSDADGSISDVVTDGGQVIEVIYKIDSNDEIGDIITLRADKVDTNGASNGDRSVFFYIKSADDFEDGIDNGDRANTTFTVDN